jgi:hypothetical protein
MRYLLETTSDWNTDVRIPNHTYILEDGRSGRMLGYIKEGTSDPIMFSKPLPFSRTRRTFKELKR